MLRSAHLQTLVYEYPEKWCVEGCFELQCPIQTQKSGKTTSIPKSWLKADTNILAIQCNNDVLWQLGVDDFNFKPVAQQQSRTQARVHEIMAFR